MVRPPNLEVVHLVPPSSVPSLDTGQIVRGATAYNQSLSQHGHRRVHTSSVKRSKCLPRVCGRIVKLCRGQIISHIVPATSRINSFFIFVDTNMASVARSLVNHTRFPHPSTRRIIC